MKTAITIARAGTDFTVLKGPEVPVNEQRRGFKQLKVELQGLYDAIEMWTSAQGRVKRYKFKTAQAPAQDEDRDEPIAPATESTSTESAPAAPVTPAAAKPLKGIAAINAARKAAKAAAGSAESESSPAKGKKASKTTKSAAKAAGSK